MITRTLSRVFTCVAKMPISFTVPNVAVTRLDTGAKDLPQVRENETAQKVYLGEEA